jgi:curved DNA-binding protein CbpA
MSAPELPEDVSLWPQDPHALLGVSPEVLPADLRRAYARLIRVYKPEQSPEQFRRIREAYETVLRLTELVLFFRGKQPSEPEAQAKVTECPSVSFACASGFDHGRLSLASATSKSASEGFSGMCFGLAGQVWLARDLPE